MSKVSMFFKKVKLCINNNQLNYILFFKLLSLLNSFPQILNNLNIDFVYSIKKRKQMLSLFMNIYLVMEKKIMNKN